MKKPIIGLLVAALLPWSVAMCGHYAVADTSTQAPAPLPANKVHYKITVTVVHPKIGPVDQLTYGDQKTGPYWYVTADECQKVVDGGVVPDFDQTKAKMLVMVRKIVDPNAVNVYECVAVPVPQPGEEVN